MTWILLLWPPLAFFSVLAAASIVAVRRGASSQEAASTWVTDRISHLLAITLVVVGATLALLAALNPPLHASLIDGLATGSIRGVVVGLAVGAAIAGIYFGGLDRLVVRAQARFGDYVPAGSTAGLGKNRRAFFVANVLLAPLVEELWYRGALFDALDGSFPPGLALAIGCVAFGLFHWPGGAWYVLVTGVLVGGACWGVRAWDDGLFAPYAAHLALNGIEYVVLTRRAGAQTV